MPVRLGEGIDWSVGVAPLEPPPPTADERRHLEILSAILALRDALAVFDHAAPAIHVDAADLSPLIEVVRSAPVPAVSIDTDRLVAAIAEVLPRTDESVGTVLEQVAEQLRRMNKKVTAMAVMPSGGSSGHVIVDSGNLALSQPVDLLDRAGREVGRVTVVNPTASPETGLAKDTTVGEVRNRLPGMLAPNGGLNVNLVNVPPEFEEFTVLASGTRTATFTGEAFTNARHKGLRLYLNVTAAGGTLAPALDVKLQTQDPASLAWADMPNAAFPQATAAGLWVLVIYPGINQTASGSAVRVSNMMSRRWRLVHTIGGTAPSFTYSVGGVYLP